MRKPTIALMLAASALALALSAPAGARPPFPPHGHRPPPAFHRPPPPVHYRVHHHHDNDYWVAPLLVGGALLGTQLYRDSRREPEVVVVPQTTVPAAPPVPQVYTWYWCESEGAYYPSVPACPLGWTPVTGTSPTQPPAPPR